MSISLRLWWSFNTLTRAFQGFSPTKYIKTLQRRVRSVSSTSYLAGFVCYQHVKANVRVLHVPPPLTPPFSIPLSLPLEGIPNPLCRLPACQDQQNMCFPPPVGSQPGRSFTGGDIAGPGAPAPHAHHAACETPNIPNDEFHFGQQTDKWMGR